MNIIVICLTKEENVAVAGAVTTYCLKRRLYNVLSNATYWHSHRQIGAPVINIQSTIRTATDLCKSVALLCILVATVIHKQSLRSHICVYSPYREAVRTKQIEVSVTVVNAARKGNLPACHFRYMI